MDQQAGQPLVSWFAMPVVACQEPVPSIFQLVLVEMKSVQFHLREEYKPSTKPGFSSISWAPAISRHSSNLPKGFAHERAKLRTCRACEEP
jgi:hypothetical protein